MRNVFLLILTAMLLASNALSANTEKAKQSDKSLNNSINATSQQSEQKNNKLDLKLNKETTILLAEIILVNRFGEKVLKQKPWIATDNGDSFKIVGSFHGGPNARGGVAEIIISKSDASVLSIIHGK